MTKHVWAIIAGVCVVALIAVGFIIVHALSPGTHPEVEPVELTPAHWWKMEITEQQRSSLATLWGKDFTAAQLIQALWSDVLQQMPQKAVAGYEEARINSWPAETFEEWHGRMICVLQSVPDDQGPLVCSI